MDYYNYREHLTDDIKDFLNDNYDSTRLHKKFHSNPDELYNELYDKMFIADSVTGNSSGSYTFSTLEAEKNLVGNWGLLQEAVAEFDPQYILIKKGPETCDILIRCYLLPEAIDTVLNELA